MKKDVIDRIHEAKPTCTTHTEWVPGHKNIEGNEPANQAAKAVVASSTTPQT
jgi:ribonuclease HI